MDCQTFEKYLENLPGGPVEKAPLEELRRHRAECPRCRNKYADVLEGGPRDENVPRTPAEKHEPVPPGKIDSDNISDLSEPMEYKEVPLKFSLHLDGREEEIKIVEPRVDLPLPEGGRLVVCEKDTSLCDVIFEFNPHSKRPYELNFRVMMGVTYAENHLVAFGTVPEVDQDLLSVYHMTIIDHGGVRADIEMTRGKARLIIVYKPSRAARQ